MALFGKREKAFEVWGDKGRWNAAKQALKEAGIKIMESGFYDTEPPLCGCGAKLDHRDFGPNGKIDRLTYYISVKPEDVARAKELLADLVKPEQGKAKGPFPLFNCIGKRLSLPERGTPRRPRKWRPDPPGAGSH